jgi:hypothetical protein
VIEVFRSGFRHDESIPRAAVGSIEPADDILAGVELS